MTRVYIGTFPAGYTRVAVPPEAFAKAAAALDHEAEEARRQATKLATAPRVLAVRKAKARGRLRQALHRLIEGGRAQKI
jgi:hypothetical protein